MKKVILGIAAHPDDLDFGASGSFAKWIREGARAYYLICTDGCKGSDDPSMTEAKLVKIRAAEQREAAKILGLKDLFFLGYKDTQLVADLKLKKDIVRVIRQLKPDIVVTMDPTVVYAIRGNQAFINHTDHRAAGQAAIDAVFPLSRDRLTFPELEKEGLSPHKVEAVYLTRFDEPSEIIDISATVDLKIKALLAHKSQIKEEMVEAVKKRAAALGKKHGFKYAEGFVKLVLPL